ARPGRGSPRSTMVANPFGPDLKAAERLAMYKIGFGLLPAPAPHCQCSDQQFGAVALDVWKEAGAKLRSSGFSIRASNLELRNRRIRSSLGDRPLPVTPKKLAISNSIICDRPSGRTADTFSVMKLAKVSDRSIVRLALSRNIIGRASITAATRRL